MSCEYGIAGCQHGRDDLQQPEQTEANIACTCCCDGSEWTPVQPHQEEAA